MLLDVLLTCIIVLMLLFVLLPAGADAGAGAGGNTLQEERAVLVEERLRVGQDDRDWDVVSEKALWSCSLPHPIKLLGECFIGYGQAPLSALYPQRTPCKSPRRDYSGHSFEG